MLPSWSECRPVGGHSPMRLLRQSHGLVVPDVAAKGSPARARHPRLAGTPSICYCIARLSRCGSSGGNWNQPWRRLSRPPELQVFGASRPGARATVENLARHLTVIYRRCGPFRPGFCEDKGNPGWRGCRTSRSKIALPSMLWPLNCRDAYFRWRVCCSPGSVAGRLCQKPVGGRWPSPVQINSRGAGIVQ